MKSNGQLTLWQYGKPADDVARFFRLGESKAEDGSVKAVSITLMKRKDLGTALDLKGKTNVSKLDAKSLELTDALKGIQGKQVIGIVQAQEWTGGSIRVRQTKNGRRATFTFVEVDRNQGQLNLDNDSVAAYLATLSEDEQIALMEQAEARKQKPVDVAATSVAA